MTRARHLSIIHIVFVFLILLAGCARSTVSDAVALTQNAATVIFSTRQTQLPTITPTRTKRPTWTPIVSPSPPTPTPIWTPLPTVSNSEAALLIQEWLEGSIECQFPCWAGITPGITTWQEAKQRLEAVVNILTTYEKTLCSFGSCNVMAWNSKSGEGIDGIVKSQLNGLIHDVSVEGFQIYPLQNVLSQYGPPEEVFLYYQVINWSIPNDLLLDIILVYPNSRLIVKYVWNANIMGEEIFGCVQEAQIHLLITNLDPFFWNDEMVKIALYGHQDADEIDLASWEELTHMTILEFYDQFRIIDGNECIVIPLEK